MASPAANPLRIIIVGAGICGLSAASALRGEGHDIVILEKSKTNKEIGAAISLGPNAVNILVSWGFDFVRSRCGTTTGFEIRDADTGDVTFTMVDDWHARFGQPWTTLHRVDLHNELKLMATDPDISDTTPALLRTGVNIVDVDVNEASVTLSDGEVIHGDVIIGADGGNSFVREKVLERASPLIPTGHAMYRVLIPAEALAGDPSLNELYTATPMHRGWNKKNRFLLSYWCRDQQFFNVVGVVPADEPKVAATGWEGTGSLSEFRELFADFANPIPQLLSHATSAGLWGVSDLDPLETWVAGRTIVLGDAAHPMLPTQAHSGGMAIEDAEALSVALGTLTSSPSGSNPSTIKINSLLKQVQAVRYDRATLVQLRSRAAAGYYFNIPMAAERLEKLGTVTPPEGMAQVFGYKGAKEWAKEKQMDLPAFV